MTRINSLAIEEVKGNGVNTFVAINDAVGLIKKYTQEEISKKELTQTISELDEKQLNLLELAIKSLSNIQVKKEISWLIETTREKINSRSHNWEVFEETIEKTNKDVTWLIEEK